MHLDGLNTEHKFQVWVTILGHTSLHFTSSTHFVKVWGESVRLNVSLRKVSFAPESEPQELPVMRKDGDVEVCVF